MIPYIASSVLMMEFYLAVGGSTCWGKGKVETDEMCWPLKQDLGGLLCKGLLNV